PAYGPQNDVTLKMPAFEWVHVQLHQQKGMISLSPPTICNSALSQNNKYNEEKSGQERMPGADSPQELMKRAKEYQDKHKQ
ncbi:hypothetical protein ACUX5C_25170, partial [Salmonella enterica]